MHVPTRSGWVAAYRPNVRVGSLCIPMFPWSVGQSGVSKFGGKSRLSGQPGMAVFSPSNGSPFPSGSARCWCGEYLFGGLLGNDGLLRRQASNPCHLGAVHVFYDLCERRGGELSEVPPLV